MSFLASSIHSTECSTLYSTWSISSPCVGGQTAPDSGRQRGPDRETDRAGVSQAAGLAGSTGRYSPFALPAGTSAPSLCPPWLCRHSRPTDLHDTQYGRSFRPGGTDGAAISGGAVRWTALANTTHATRTGSDPARNGNPPPTPANVNPLRNQSLGEIYIRIVVK